MKKLILTIVAIMAFCALCVPTYAALVDHGGGLIYDTDLDITWYYDANAVAKYWPDAMSWAAKLTVGGTAAGSWRLPSTPGTKIANITEGELGHLYTELQDSANAALFKRLTRINSSTNLQYAAYWTANSFPVGNPPYLLAWYYILAHGRQENDCTEGEIYIYSLAVHQGNVFSNQ